MVDGRQCHNVNKAGNNLVDEAWIGDIIEDDGYQQHWYSSMLLYGSGVAGERGPMMGGKALLTPYLDCQVKGELIVTFINADLVSINVNLGQCSQH
jgi:hypothetical protein